MLQQIYDAPVISCSHFVPRPELMPPRSNWGRNSFICDAVGSHLLEKQLRSINARLHIFGHTHISWDAYIDGTHYLQNAVRYPHERIQWYAVRVSILKGQSARCRTRGGSPIARYLRPQEVACGLDSRGRYQQPAHMELCGR